MSDVKDEPVDTGALQEDVQIAERATAEVEVPRETQEPEPEAAEPQEPEAPEQATEDEPAPSEAGRAHPPLPRGVQRKINTLTRRNGEAYARIQELEQRLAQVEGHPAPQAQDDDPRPTRESCDFDESRYDDELYAWRKRQESKQETQRQAQERMTQAVTTLQTAEDAFAEANPDYFEVAHAPNVPISKDMAELLLETPETAPAMAYHLAKHPELAASIAKMSPAAMGRALAKLEGELSAPPQSQAQPQQRAPVQVTQAPPPVSTLRPAAPVSRGLEDKDMPMTEWIAERKRQRQAKGLR